MILFRAAYRLLGIAYILAQRSHKGRVDPAVLVVFPRGRVRAGAMERDGESGTAQGQATSNLEELSALVGSDMLSRCCCCRCCR